APIAPSDPAGLTPVPVPAEAAGRVSALSAAPETVALTEPDMGVMALAVTAAAQTPGLLAGWNFDETSGTIAADSSGNGNAATLVNGVAHATGQYGGRLTFDGVHDYLTVPNPASINVSGSGLTLSMWIRPQVSGADSVVLGKPWNATMASPYYQYGIELAGGTRPTFYVGTTGGALSASMGSTLAVNQWSYLAVT